MFEFLKKKIKAKDTRAFRRLRAQGLLRYKLASDHAGKGTVVNPREISANGASFIADRGFHKDTLLEIELCIPPFKDFFTVMAKVMAISKIKDVHQYWVRVRFTAIDAEIKNRINAFIENISKHPSMQRYLDKKAEHFKRSS